jgi:hypothetical protein
MLQVKGIDHSGELVIVDEDNRQVARAELFLEDAYDVDEGEEFGLVAKITWVKE